MCIKEEQIEDAWWSLILFCWLELNIPGLAWICSPLCCSQLACREKWESSIKKANSSLLFTNRWLLWFTWRRPRWSLCNWEGPLPRIPAPWRQSALDGEVKNIIYHYLGKIVIYCECPSKVIFWWLAWTGWQGRGIYHHIWNEWVIRISKI